MSLEWLDVLVEQKWLEAEDSYGLTLTSPNGGDLPEFTAGAHIDVHVTDDLIRQYSIYNAPDERSAYRICVTRDPQSRGGSKAIAEDIQQGDILRISKPRNLFELNLDVPNYLLIAGGIGITPIFSMAEQLHRQEKPFKLVYRAKSRQRAALVEQLEEERFAGHVGFHFSDESEGEPFKLDELIASQSQDTHLYVCGPVGMIESVLAAAEKAGWDPSRVHYESFSPMPSDAAEGEAFRIELAKSGTTLVVPPGRSIAEVLNENGIEVPLSCEQGLCGTCIVNVLEGEPDHRDSFLTRRQRKANGSIITCCSRSLTPSLVLDL